MLKLITIILIIHSNPLVAVRSSKNFSNFCLDALYHKSSPGPESSLHDQCTPWKNRACCTTNTTKNIDNMLVLYEFNFDHCSHKKPLSTKCRNQFKKDLCFYECDPNIGPWAVKVNMKKRNERFFQVPLCASECNRWFKDCENDYTCAKNWVKDFIWNDTNHCSRDCVTFKEMYGTAENFCQLIWDHSWKYTADNEHCMKLWFDPANGNPNDAVFIEKMRSVRRSSTLGLLNVCYILIIFTIIIFVFLYVSYMRMKSRNGNGFVCLR